MAALGPNAVEPIVVAADRVVTPHGVLTPGWLRIDGGRIHTMGEGEPPEPVTYQAQWALPGFIDLHVHGGGGASFTEGGPQDARRAAAFHRAHGTTRIVASLVTAPVDELERRVTMLAALADEGVIDGIHLEGPFLSELRCGAQDPRYLTAPDVAIFRKLHAAARGWLKMITIAPELPGALDVIRSGDRRRRHRRRGPHRRLGRGHRRGDRGGRQPRHPPVQRHAPLPPPRPRPGWCAP